NEKKGRNIWHPAKKNKNMKKSPNPDRSVSIPFGAHAMIRHLAPGMEQDSTENYNAKFFARDQEKGKPLPQTDKNFFKFWPPTLFAFTSLFFETTGAYALISRNPWTPRSPNWYKAVNSSALEWRIGIYKKFSEEPKFRQLILNSIPQRNLGSREEAQKTNYAELAKVLKLEDKTPTFSVVSDPDEFKDSLKDATSIFPKILNRAWDLIEKNRSLSSC
ncbi:MAG: hypothetical protein VST68_09465, partial [Nitrospirota bacterium]|nr:hypothetical protein [Nitrospirota bacterium]